MEHFDERDRRRIQEIYRGPPQGRLSTTEEQAQTILFLVGPHSGHITGAVLATDGGITAGEYELSSRAPVPGL